MQNFLGLTGKGLVDSGQIRSGPLDLDRAAEIGRGFGVAAQCAGGEAARRWFAGVGLNQPSGALFERSLHGE